MFETMCDLIPEFKSVFRDQYSRSLQNKTTTIWKRLGEAVGGIFMELANLIRQDSPRSGKGSSFWCWISPDYPLRDELPSC